ncbi:hypothetical protein DF268_35880 [Streptomyces sp. V2]|uniref:hypothetical protein n=1 Tax=Streptomyces sp. V2 TaxID=1424099 RepID=UPI000D67179D|nr:hypothetical protein [Streptomyces sp. V2]PWG08755.1 hypothetical protein DF268_35880 [Streptomyces sp. V2]
MSTDNPLSNFFQAGHAYTTQNGYQAPDSVWDFACAGVTVTPGRQSIAFGFVRLGGADWTPTGFGFADFTEHRWYSAPLPEWLAACGPRSPLTQAEDAKRRRDLQGELEALGRGVRSLTEASWYPARPGDLVHIHYPAAGAGDFPEFGETYIVGATDTPDLMSLQLLAHTLPAGVEDADALVGDLAVEDVVDPIVEIWMEAGPHALTIVRDGRIVHAGGAS